MKKDTLKTIGISYSWVVLASSLLYFYVEQWGSGFGMIFRGATFLYFMYGKNNWRIFVFILAVLGLINAVSSIDNIWYLLDIVGNIAIAWYALREKK
jgi:hypothetical protein